MAAIILEFAKIGNDEIELGERERIEAAKNASFRSPEGLFYPFVAKPNEWATHKNIGEFLIVIGSTFAKEDTVLKLAENGSLSIKHIEESQEKLILNFEILCMRLANFLRFLYEYFRCLERGLEVKNFRFQILLEGYNGCFVDYSMFQANRSIWREKFAPDEKNEVVKIPSTKGDISGQRHKYREAIKTMGNVIWELAFKVKGQVQDPTSTSEARLELSAESVEKNILRFLTPEIISEYDRSRAPLFL